MNWMIKWRRKVKVTTRDERLAMEGQLEHKKK